MHPLASKLHTADRVIDLPTGRLTLSVQAGQRSLDELLTFAARRNPRRGFLFVSKVLGRYLPVRPAVLHSVQRELANGLAADLPGPVVVLGVAEAGVALAAGVHGAYVDRTRRDDVLFTHSTRYQCNTDVAFEFLEVHSHAPSHRVFMPDTPEKRRLLETARTLVVVDDEVTTGRTVAAMVDQWSARFPAIKTVVHAVLTSWLDRPFSDALGNPDLHAELVTLLAGRYDWQRDPTVVPHMPDVTGDGRCKGHLFAHAGSRFGQTVPTPVSLADVPALEPGSRVLVLGNGEFQTAALAVADALTAQGHSAFFQCVTRAPVMPWGPIETVHTFRDSYEEGIPNYLYNASPGHYDHVLVCTETPASTVPNELVDHFEATVLEF